MWYNNLLYFSTALLWKKNYNGDLHYLWLFTKFKVSVCVPCSLLWYAAKPSSLNTLKLCCHLLELNQQLSGSTVQFTTQTSWTSWAIWFSSRSSAYYFVPSACSRFDLKHWFSIWVNHHHLDNEVFQWLSVISTLDYLDLLSNCALLWVIEEHDYYDIYISYNEVEGSSGIELLTRDI